MRIKRAKKFKNDRRKKVRKILLLTVVMPCLLALIGYLIAATIILPAMSS